MRIQTPADLARLVKTRRQSRGLTQQDVADAVGITRQSLARIEHGHSGVSFDTVLRLFDELGVTLDTDSGPSRQNAAQIPIPDTDALQRAAASVIRTSAHNLDPSAVAAAATGSINAAALPRWRESVHELTSQIQENAARYGPPLSTQAARQALLNAAVEAGDPDRTQPSTAREGDPQGTEDKSRETSDSERNG